jgi:hypothetical protein
VERWIPVTEDDVNAAIIESIFEETHYFDGKREVEAGSGANKELARDLAAFALDGGGLLIGIEEDKTSGRWRQHPVPVSGLSERIEQVAQSLVDPPLYVRPHLIGSSDGSERGYIFVEVPPSPTAPHMIEGRYYGRGDKTRIRLSDADVVRHHTRRESIEAVGNRLLDEEIDREPIMPSGDRQHGHMYLIAQPLAAYPTVARDFVRANNADLHQLIQRSEVGVPRDIRNFAPSAGHAGQRVRRAAGTAMCSGAGLEKGRMVPGETLGDRTEANMLDVEFREDGGVRVFVGRMTDSGPVFERSVKTILDGLAVAYALRLAGWATAVGEATGYRGVWVFGIHGDRLRGLQSHRSAQSVWGDSQTYDAADYREVTTATHLEMADRPEAVAERLVGRLLRGLGTWTAYERVFEPRRSSEQDEAESG